MFNLPWAKDSKRISDKRYNKKLSKNKRAYKKWLTKEIKSKIKFAERKGKKWASVNYFNYTFYSKEYLDIIENIKSELKNHGYKVETNTYMNLIEINWEE